MRALRRLRSGLRVYDPVMTGVVEGIVKERLLLWGQYHGAIKHLIDSIRGDFIKSMRDSNVSIGLLVTQYYYHVIV